VTTSAGFGHLQKGHGIAFGDVDNDGDEDVFEVMGGALPGDAYPSALFENPGHPKNHWITLEVEGVQTNRAAFGARICVLVKNGRTERRIYRTVGYGSSFGGNPLRQHIGIGPSTEIERIEITWTVSKSAQRFAHVAADQVLHVVEGTDSFVPVHPRRFTLAPSSPAHMHTIATPQ